MRRRSHTPPSDGDVSQYKNTNRRMTELPGHSIQKFLSDRGKRKTEERRQDGVIKTTKASSRRHQSLCPDDARRPRRLSVCESVISEKELEHSVTNQRPALSARLTNEEPEMYLMMSRSSRLSDRRQSTPVMYLTESLNKLALSSLSNSSGELDVSLGPGASHIKSGHKEIERIFSSDEDTEKLGSFHLNDLNCPNSSTTQVN